MNDDRMTCPACEGRGHYIALPSVERGTPGGEEPCDVCMGTGEINTDDYWDSVLETVEGKDELIVTDAEDAPF